MKLPRGTVGVGYPNPVGRTAEGSPAPRGTVPVIGPTSGRLSRAHPYTRPSRLCRPRGAPRLRSPPERCARRFLPERDPPEPRVRGQTGPGSGRRRLVLGRHHVLRHPGRHLQPAGERRHHRAQPLPAHPLRQDRLGLGLTRGSGCARTCARARVRLRPGCDAVHASPSGPSSARAAAPASTARPARPRTSATTSRSWLPGGTRSRSAAPRTRPASRPAAASRCRSSSASRRA